MDIPETFEAIPTMPGELMPLFSSRPKDFDLQTAMLWEMVLDELLDDEFLTRQHHNTGTHDKGCRGPLCRKAYREHPRRHTPKGFSGYTPREERIYDPILEFFHTIAKHRIRSYQRELYKELA